MLNVTVQVPASQRIEIRKFRGFTDSECCPPGWFNEIENIDFEDDGSLCQRWGSQILCPDTPLTTQGRLRIEHLACFKGKILIFQGSKISCKNEDGSIDLVQGLKDTDIMNAADEENCSDSDYYNEHLLVVDDACSNPSKLYCDENGDLVAKTMGLPKPPEDVLSFTPVPLPGGLNGGSIIFAYFWCCRYTTQSGTEFLDYSPVCYQKAGPFTNQQLFWGPVIDDFFECPDGTQYDEENITFHVYRTALNGTTFFKVAEWDRITFQNFGPVSNVIFNAAADNALINGEVIYNQGSTIQWTPAPPSSFVEVIDDVAWYAGRTCVEGKEYNNRLYQSIPRAPWSVPREFYVEFDGTITGLSQYSRFPIVSVVDDCGHCKLYRVEGRLDIFGRSQLIPRVIADSTAAINNQSFVIAETGLYFLGFGGSGIYRTDGYRVEKVTDNECNFDDTYCELIETELQRKRAYGVYDKYRNRIYWGVTTTPGLAENNKYLVYHEHHNAFTWHSSGDNFQPSASIYDDKQLIRGDGRGYLFEHNHLYYTDPTVDVDSPASEWGTTRIPWCLKTTPIDAGDCLNNKQFQKIYFQGKPETNSTFGIESFDNGCKTPKTLNLVEFKNSEGWCASSDGWCQGPNGWCVGEGCHMHQVRRFACTRTMSKSKAIRICATSSVIECGTEEADYIVWNPLENSLANQSGIPFDNQSIGDTVCIEGQEVEIENIIFGGKALVTLDPKPDAGNYAWARKGFPKNERFCLSCMGMVYCVLGDVGGEFSQNSSKTAQWNSFQGANG